jgi:hypothetical protein
MNVTSSSLTKAAGAAAAVAGAIFIAVQIGHPHLDATSIQTTQMAVRDILKVLMATLALAGITGMYLSQVRRNGVLGLVGYLVLSAGYLMIMGTAYVAAFVMPTVAASNPRTSPTWPAACSSASRSSAPVSSPAGRPCSSRSAASSGPHSR